jgi:RNA-directed DNA polymerase
MPATESHEAQRGQVRRRLHRHRRYPRGAGKRSQTDHTAFLAERGLTLSEDKTRITHIEEGFDFLGFNLRKYKEKLLIKPAKDSIKHVMKKIRDTFKANLSAKTDTLIKHLNPLIRGWANY